jgi:hypothetical protein
MAFFLRKCVLIIKDKKKIRKIHGGGGIDKSKEATFNDITYQSRVAFEISKNKDDIYMSAEFTIFGLNKTQLELDLKKNEIIFYAGYEDSDFDEKGDPLRNPIFRGFVFHIEDGQSAVGEVLKIYAGVNSKSSDKVPFFSLPRQPLGISFLDVLKRLKGELLKKKSILLDYTKLSQQDLKEGTISKKSYAVNFSQDLRDYMDLLCKNLSTQLKDNVNWYMSFDEGKVDIENKLEPQEYIKYKIILFQDAEKISNDKITLIYAKDLIVESDTTRERDYKEKYFYEKIGAIPSTPKATKEETLTTRKISSIIRNDINLEKQIVYIPQDKKPINYKIEGIKYVGDTHKNDDSWKITLDLKAIIK